MGFNTIVGQQTIVNQLKEATENGRVPHAQLFSGSIGAGAFALALAQAKHLLLTDPMATDATPQKLEKLVHPDLHFSYPVVLSKANKVEIATDVLTQWRSFLSNSHYFSVSEWYENLGDANKQGVIGVKEAEGLIKKLHLKPYEGSRKVLVLLLPELMNNQAANKLLKLIEEPPENTFFLLVSEQAEQILPTILSRTQLIRVPGIEADAIQAELQKTGSNVDEAQSIAGLSEGNLWLAKTLASPENQDAFYFEQFKFWMRLCFKRDVLAVIDWVEEMAGIGREKQKAFFEYTLHLLRQSMLNNYTEGKLVRLMGEEKGFIGNFAPHLQADAVLQLMHELNNAHYAISRNAYAKILFLDLSFNVFTLFKKGDAKRG